MMRRQSISIPALLFFMTLLTPTVVCGASARSLTRTADPLEIPGACFPEALGASLESIHVSALRAGRWEPIPCQIDERKNIRTESGEEFPDYVFPKGVLPTADHDPAFDADDLLVFLAGDLGDQAGEGIGPSEGIPAYEIEVTDPRDGSTGWAYVSVGSVRAIPDGENYVSYRHEESILEANRYRIFLSRENPIIYERLILKGGSDTAGAQERNIVDRFKMRAKASLFIPLLRLRRDESDIRSRTVAWIDGPVRVVCRTETRIDLLWGFATPVQVQDTFFYPDHFYFWVDMASPVALKRLTSDAEVRLTVDLSEQAVGMLFVSRLNPSGFVVDGLMSEQERRARTQDQDWYAVSDGVDTLFSRLMIPAGTPVGVELQYMDDRGLPDPPEAISGRWGDAGYRLSGLASVGKGRYRLFLHTMIAGTYRRGEERAFLDIMDRPLAWKCRFHDGHPRESGGPASPAASAGK